MYKKLSESKTPHIFTTIANPSNKDILINKGDILVQLFIKKRSMLIRLARWQLNPSEKWQPIVYLRDLTKEQRKKVYGVLRNQCKVFLKDPSYISNIPNFQMNINLTDSFPVHGSYSSISRKLYDEVKNHTDDFLTNQWIRNSHCPFVIYIYHWTSRSVNLNSHSKSHLC